MVPNVNQVGPLDRATMPDPMKSTPVPLLFLDTETTSLRVPWRAAPRQVWEVGAIRRWPDGTEQEWRAYVRDPDLTDADPISLSIGGFYDRHPQYLRQRWASAAISGGNYLHSEAEVAYLIEWLARGATIIGAVPDFDASTLDALLARHGLAWGGHYHLICAEVYAAGAIGWEPPYDSKALSLALGVDPAAYPQHEALADARWARDLYDAARAWPRTAETTQPPR